MRDRGLGQAAKAPPRHGGDRRFESVSPHNFLDTAVNAEMFYEVAGNLIERGLYVHYSSRPDDPKVPPRSMETFSGGSGPLGVYTYPMDFKAHTFGERRPYIFILRPTVSVLKVGEYGRADLERDLMAVDSMMDTKESTRLWNGSVRRNELRGAGHPFTKIWYIVNHLTRSTATDPEDRPNSSQLSCADPELSRQIFVKLGYKVIEDRMGIMYSSEPQQAVFLTDDSFEVVERQDNPKFRKV